MSKTLSQKDLLTWLNNRLNGTLPPIRKIEQLGNGVAFLHLLNLMHPNAVRPSRINHNASLEHENAVNLKLLATAFHKLRIEYNIEVAKLACKKFQDSLNLLQFMHRLDNSRRQPAESALSLPNFTHSSQSHSPRPEESSVLRIKPPNSIQRELLSKSKVGEPLIQLPMRSSLPDYPNQLQTVHQVFISSERDQIKLQKIKHILFGNIDLKKQNHNQQEIQGQIQDYIQEQVQGQTRITPFAEKFKKVIRPTMMKKSKYLTSQDWLNESKVECSNEIWDTAQPLPEEENMLLSGSKRPPQSDRKSSASEVLLLSDQK